MQSGSMLSGDSGDEEPDEWNAGDMYGGDTYGSSYGNYDDFAAEGGDSFDTEDLNNDYSSMVKTAASYMQTKKSGI